MKLKLPGSALPSAFAPVRPYCVRQAAHGSLTGKVTSALCHGSAILAFATLSNGDPLVKGKTVTGFPNVEALEGDAYRTPANIECDAEFTNSCEGK